MKKQLEIAIIKAHSNTFQGYQLYWILSKNQLEFLFKEVEIFSSPSFVATAKYQEVMLPVINLEKHYGLEEKDEDGPAKYLVVRSVNEKKEMVKFIIRTLQTLKIHKLKTEVKSMQSMELPQNSEDVLAMYSLGIDKLGVVPNFIGIGRSLKVRGNEDMELEIH